MKSEESVIKILPNNEPISIKEETKEIIQHKCLSLKVLRPSQRNEYRKILKTKQKEKKKSEKINEAITPECLLSIFNQKNTNV